MTHIRNRTILIALFSFSFFIFFSCTKKTDEKTEEKSKVETENVSDTIFTESDEDLLTVDYKQFYDELAPHGEWVQVSAKELGLDLKKEKNPGQIGSILNDLIGVKNAYADDVDFGMFFVWRPSPNLAVSVTAGTPAVYTPYTNGQWVNTDAGWYFKAATPYEETTCHYGRWVYSPSLGWIWVPGRVWSPAWVEWRENDDYIAWAPVPPSVYIVNDVLRPVIIDEDRYIIVDKKHFVEPSVYKYRYFYKENKNKAMIKVMTKIDGVMIKNKTVINKGPDVVNIEKHSRKKIEQVKIKKVGNQNEVRNAAGEIDVYTPPFTKTKGKDTKESVTKPNKFVPFSDAGSMSKKESKGEEKGIQNQEKEMKKEGKEMKKEEKSKEKLDKQKGKDKEKGNEKGMEKQKGNKKSGDDQNMKKGNEKLKENKKENREKGNKDMKQNEPKPKGNDKVKGKGKH
jgi:hypothetical protein